MNITVKIKNVYGNELIYPACEHSRLLARLAGKKTLSRQDINLISLYRGTQDVKTTQATAIEHGCGQYNPKSAAFEWLDATVPPVDMAQLGVLPMHPEPQHKPKGK